MRSIWQSFQAGESHCDGCPGQEASYPLMGLGSTNASVMLVGMEPAYNIDESSVDSDMNWWDARDAMTDDRRSSMNPLWKHMMNIGIAAQCSPTDLYFTNLSKCNVDDFDGCFEHCRSYLPREIAVVEPQVLLLYGSKVINVVFDMFGIDWSGTVGDVHTEPHETGSLTLLPLYHWGYAYRQGDVETYNEEVKTAVSEVLS